MSFSRRTCTENVAYLSTFSVSAVQYFVLFLLDATQWASRRGLSCFALQKIEVDPVKFAAELESYEDLKRRLVVDAALFGAVGAFAVFQVRRVWRQKNSGILARLERRVNAF